MVVRDRYEVVRRERAAVDEWVFSGRTLHVRREEGDGGVGL